VRLSQFIDGFFSAAAVVAFLVAEALPMFAVVAAGV
jgi:hypothetical protein